jgi:hypothetical protein
MSLGSQFGLLPQGFVGKQVQDIEADLNAALQAAFGASINLTAQSRFGQIVGIMKERYLELWNLAEVVHAAFNPDAATNSDLVNVAAITGTLPLVPLSSKVTETMTGTPGTVLNTGRQVSVVGTGSVFQTLASGTITAVPAWANATSYTVGQRVNRTSFVWQCQHAGTSSSAPTGGVGTTFTDGALVWLNVGAGTGAVDIPMASVLTGPIVAAQNTLKTIVTPVAGWSNAVNLADAVLGISVEPDATFRIRRQQELHGQGKAAIEAIRAAVLQVPAVTACTVFENVTDVTNSDGMPPHSVEVLVQGGDPTAICTAIFQNVAAGIATTGNQSPVTITDSQGITHSILFSRPVIVPIWVTVNVLVYAPQWPANGAAQVTQNLVDYSATLTPDYDIFSAQLSSAYFAGIPAQGLPGVSGILDPGLPLIGTSNPPVSSATVSITSRQLGQISSGNIVVNVTFGVP